MIPDNYLDTTLNQPAAVHDAPIVNVDITYIDEIISSVRVTFIDQIEATYEATPDIDEIFRRLAEQQRAYMQGTPV